MTCRVSVCALTSVAVDYLREAEWKVCYFGPLGFLSASGLAVAGEQGGEQWASCGHEWEHTSPQSHCYQSGNSLPANQLASSAPPADPPRSLPEVPSLARRAWVSVLRAPTVTFLGRDNTHSNWLPFPPCLIAVTLPSIGRHYAPSRLPVPVEKVVCFTLPLTTTDVSNG